MPTMLSIFRSVGLPTLFFSAHRDHTRLVPQFSLLPRVATTSTRQEPRNDRAPDARGKIGTLRCARSAMLGPVFCERPGSRNREIRRWQSFWYGWCLVMADAPCGPMMLVFRQPLVERVKVGISVLSELDPGHTKWKLWIAACNVFFNILQPLW